MSAARRYLDKAKEAAEALKTAASLSAAEGEVSRLRVRLKESETELAQARAAGTEATDRLGALSLRYESSEAALHSAARVIQAALEDTLATLDPAVSDAGAPPLPQPMQLRGQLLEKAGSDAGVLAHVCSSVGEVCRALRRSERRASSPSTHVDTRLCKGAETSSLRLGLRCCPPLEGC